MMTMILRAVTTPLAPNGAPGRLDSRPSGAARPTGPSRAVGRNRQALPPSASTTASWRRSVERVRDTFLPRRALGMGFVVVPRRKGRLGRAGGGPRPSLMAMYGVGDILLLGGRCTTDLRGDGGGRSGVEDRAERDPDRASRRVGEVEASFRGGIGRKPGRRAESERPAIHVGDGTSGRRSRVGRPSWWEGSKSGSGELELREVKVE